MWALTGIPAATMAAIRRACAATLEFDRRGPGAHEDARVADRFSSLTSYDMNGMSMVTWL